MAVSIGTMVAPVEKEIIFAMATEVRSPVKPPGPIETATSSIERGLIESSSAIFEIIGKTVSTPLLPVCTFFVLSAPSLFDIETVPSR